MVITFNFRNINNPPNKALLVLLKAQNLLKQSFDRYMSMLSKKVPNPISHRSLVGTCLGRSYYKGDKSLR